MFSVRSIDGERNRRGAPLYLSSISGSFSTRSLSAEWSHAVRSTHGCGALPLCLLFAGQGVLLIRLLFTGAMPFHPLPLQGLYRSRHRFLCGNLVLPTLAALSPLPLQQPCSASLPALSPLPLQGRCRAPHFPCRGGTVSFGCEGNIRPGQLSVTQPSPPTASVETACGMLKWY